MALTTVKQETLKTEGEKDKLHLLCDNVNFAQSPQGDAELCRICLGTDGNLYSMKVDKNLSEAYGTLTGLPIENDDNIPPYLCTECSHQLMHYVHFRNKILRTHLLLLEILRKHDCITVGMIKTLNESQDVDISSVGIIHNSIDQYNLDVVHIKKENIYTDQQIPLRNIPSSVKDIVLDDIKKEDDYTISQDSPADDSVYSSSLHSGIVLDSLKVEIDSYKEESLNDSYITSDDTIYGVTFAEPLTRLITPLANQPDEPMDLTDLPGPSRSNVLTETQDAAASTSATPFAESPTLAAPKSKAQKQREDRSDNNISIEELRQNDMVNIAKVKKVIKVKTTKDLKKKSDHNLLLYDNFCCDLCSYKTVSDVQFLRHLKAHASNKLHKCNYRNNMKQNDHIGEQRFTCHVCQKTYRRKWSLQKHMKTHADEKAYMCDVCEKGFNEKRDLQNHLRTHSGEKPYGCDLCKKSFSERGNLLRHIRIHAGEKRFSCKVCKLSFNQKHHLKRHLIKHY